MIKELKDGTKWIKAKYYEGGDLKGIWTATFKIDGIRCIRGSDGKIYSRDSKPLKHTECMKGNDCEFYHKNWNTSVSILSTEEDTIIPTPDMFYSLDPIDERLYIGLLDNPTETDIHNMLLNALTMGYEGLVLRQNSKWLKVVPVKYADIFIQDIKEGEGKYKGLAGSIITSLGSVGSFELQEGMTDKQFRKELLDNKAKYIGKVAQIGYRELTCTGKFKFPKLARLRLDKDYEDLPV